MEGITPQRLRGAKMDRYPGSVTADLPLDKIRLAVPDGVEVVDGRLVWWIERVTLGPPREGFRPFGNLVYHWDEGATARDCLWRFRSLVDASPNKLGARVVNFARRYGVLGICGKGQPGILDGSLPKTWKPAVPLDLVRRGVMPKGYGLSGHREDAVSFWEPLERWLDYARACNALLRLVAALRRGIETREEDWETACRGIPTSRPLYPLILTPQAQCNAVAEMVSRWVEAAGMRLNVNWRDGLPRMELTFGGLKRPELFGTPGFDLWPSNNLFSVIGCQLAAIVCSELGVFECGICKRPFGLPEEARRPQDGRTVLCRRKKCKEKAQRIAKRNWKREHDAEKRKAKVQARAKKEG